MSNYSNNISQNLTNTPKLNIVVAFAAEARPLIDYYRLKKVIAVTQFQIFSNEEQSIRLIISGMGKIKAAAATCFIQCYESFSASNSHACFLNIGIAGGVHSIGAIFLVNKIMDQANNQVWYPWLMPNLTVATSPLITFDQPQTVYSPDYIIDMEASGFFQSASLLVTGEQIQLLKIISDNNEESLKSISTKLVTQLVEAQLTVITSFISALLTLSSIENIDVSPVKEYLVAITQHCHFTQYQKFQLREILRRWQINFSDLDPFTLINEKKSAQEVLKTLDVQLGNVWLV